MKLISCGVFLASNTASAHGVMTLDEATKYLAFLTVQGEICEVEFPEMKQAIALSWVHGWDQPTREWATNIRQGTEFQKQLVVTRTEWLPKSKEIINQCQARYSSIN
jgi:hypothetical protein